MATPEKVYWDSCVWIALINKESRSFENIRPIFERAKKSEVEIYTSIVSLMEVSKKRNCDFSDGSTIIDDIEDFKKIFFYDFINRLQLDINVALLANNFVKCNKINPLDAIHLASSCCYACDIVYTYDKGLLKYNGKTSPSGHPLRIAEPPPPEEPMLPLQ